MKQNNNVPTNYSPTQDDVNNIATMFAQVRDLAKEMGLGTMDYSIADLMRIQHIIDANIVNESPYLMRSLGIAFACVFIEHHDGYHWWMFEDEDGAECCIRFLDTEIIFFPEPFLAQKIRQKADTGEEIDVFDLYKQTSEGLTACEADLD